MNLNSETGPPFSPMTSPPEAPRTSGRDAMSDLIEGQAARKSSLLAAGMSGVTMAMKGMVANMCGMVGGSGDSITVLMKLKFPD